MPCGDPFERWLEEREVLRSTKRLRADGVTGGRGVVRGQPGPAPYTRSPQRSGRREAVGTQWCDWGGRQGCTTGGGLHL